MPLRNDTSLWWQMSGVVAAYQPIAAPGPLWARYNMAHGGSNRYCAVMTGALTWSSRRGWGGFSISNYVNSGVVPTATSAMLCRFADGAGGAWREVCGSAGTLETRFRLAPVSALNTANRSYHFANKNQLGGAAVGGGVLGMTPSTGYYNGLADASIASAWSGVTFPVLIGTWSSGGTPQSQAWDGTIQAWMIAQRPLSSAEMWTASRQMAYCDVNPEWSVWSRRRQWYYMPGGFQAAWARNANSVLQVGRQ